MDHRGSSTNTIAIDREIFFCYEPVNGPEITLVDTDPNFGQRNIIMPKPGEIPYLENVDAWLAYTQELTDKRKAKKTNEDWEHKIASVPYYLRAMVLPKKDMAGFRGTLLGKIPKGCGLSSSSALVVGVFDILNQINGLGIPSAQLVIHCGIAEWYVGTRGGAGDHAGIKLSKQNRVTALKTVPLLEVTGQAEFPAGYCMIIFDSGVIANKTGDAGNAFNEKVAVYEMGEMLLWPFAEKKSPGIVSTLNQSRRHLDHVAKKICLADAVTHLTDRDLIAFLKQLPLHVSRKDILNLLPDREKELKALFATHQEPGEGYALRAVMAFGISETKRAAQVIPQLQKGNIDGFIQAMIISHDGDRIKNIQRAADLRKQVDNNYLDDFREDLAKISGDYHCSHPDIDDMVDIAQEAGAASSRISGAGLGGSMMVLVREDKIQDVVKALQSRYYQPRGLNKEPIIAVPIEGAGHI